MSRELKILLGVSGGIAAFKAPAIVRSLRSRGHAVRCVLTRAACSFVTPLTLEVLSGFPVHEASPVASTGDGEEAHIELAQWADIACVAPATAHTMAKLAAGLADDFLTTALLAFQGRRILAPAMHTAMWNQNATRRVGRQLAGDGFESIGPEVGPLASGEVGMGRMAEIETIVEAIERGEEKPLRHRRALVTAGPTHEALDPIRFLGNRSTGKMGFAVAAALRKAGAEVTLVAGPVHRETPAGVERFDVVTAAEMKSAVEKGVVGRDIVVMSAAVADFRPVEAASQKIKKAKGIPQIVLERTEDILGSLRDLAPDALIMGFAAETEELESAARSKLERKRADFIVANDVSRSDIGMASDSNEVTVFRRDGLPVSIGIRSKPDLADDLVQLLVDGLSREQG